MADVPLFGDSIWFGLKYNSIRDIQAAAQLSKRLQFLYIGLINDVGGKAMSGIKTILKLGMAVVGCFTLANCASLTPPSETVPVAAAAVAPLPQVINELKCDFLDYQTYAATQQGNRLEINKIKGTLKFSLSRDLSNSVGIAVAIAPIKLGVGASASAENTVDNELSIPFTIDPSLKGNAINCEQARRFNQPILALKELAQGFYASEAGAPKFMIGDSIKYKGQFYLKRSAGAGLAIDVVFVKIDAAKIGRDEIFIQSFDLEVETNGSGWYMERLDPADRKRMNGIVNRQDSAPENPDAKKSKLDCRKDGGMTFCK